MYKNKKTAAVILMAGIGNRFGTKLPKQFHTIFGKPIYIYTLDVFLEFEYFDQIVLVCSKNYITRVRSEIPTSIHIIEGGNTRQESSYKALSYLENKADIVVIHDAVRPFVTTSIIKENIEAAIEHKACDTCIASADTLVNSEDGIFIDKIPNRSLFLRGQTPQSFCLSTILEAHRAAVRDDLTTTDDCSLILYTNKKVAIVQGDTKNIKITNKEDLTLATSLINQKVEESIKEELSLKDKTYLIVGGSGGIGKEIQSLLEKEGARVFPLSRTTTPYSIDLSSYESIKATFKTIKEDLGDVDGLINSAGLLKIKPFSSLGKNEISDLLSVNLLGVIYSCKEVCLNPYGHILNISSSSFNKGRKDYTLYSSAKAAIVNFTEGLSQERKDLCINTIIPERTDTNMRKEYFPNEDQTSLLSPNDVAKKVIKILKTKASGKTIYVSKTTC